jgi:hypothetical protein
MEHPTFGSLIEHLALLPAPRSDRTKRPLWLDLVGMAVCAVRCGADTWVELAAYGRAKYAGFKRFLPLPHGSPSHDTGARVFARLNPDALRSCVLAGLEGGRERTGGQWGGPGLAIDGKPSRHHFDRALGRSPLHMVSAGAPEPGLVLGQVAVEEKSHESTAIPA